MKMVINKAIPFKTEVGGTCCRERALLIKSRTIENLKKEVVRIRRLGAKVRTVRRRRSCTEKATCCPF